MAPFDRNELGQSRLSVWQLLVRVVYLLGHGQGAGADLHG
jgi:hypothetical protein